ncbi:hypothetical protein Poli38472_013579 [Pythium oligandrum]|uniref:Protein arginine N-methyltransferase 7 n=1 Tax=Pythium oligandrum TaxID=41045 RepID=A0A8K1CD02_PYTOL|nr:hypothetical protein Poli38472_013579 [Pythium oligandrum]|eukprot:TMW61116.1 hypothetical protein Poli38472_013579 [Pythium oligandrum]
MYAGADKYGGVLAGEGQPRDARGPPSPSAPPATGLSLEEAIETAAAEETVVVDVPYSYYEDEDDPSTLVTGSSQVLLAAQLNPEAGGLMWIEQEDAHDTFKNVVAMSQMTSMLRDLDRNCCYELGIKNAIASFKQKHGRAPTVLDIGTGTGLLSMFAARHGAEHVYACEMFKPMAEIAQNVTADNFPDKITVFALRSTDLVVAAEGGHLPQRADMLVSELFDSILLGEAVIPTIRHAMEHLLVPNAVIIPERATVYAHIVENETMYRFNSVAGQHLNDKGVRLARNDLAWTCTGSNPALPLHIQAFETETTALTDSVSVLSFDFTKLPSGLAPLGVRSKDIGVKTTHAGKAQAVLMWWKVSFDAEDSVVYSTKPNVQNWQDHWVQVVYPLSNPQSVQEAEVLTLRAHHDDLRIWFDVEKASELTTAPTLPMKRSLDALSSAPSSAEKPPCVCGLHLLCNAERISMLTNSARTTAFDLSIQQAIQKLAKSRDCAPDALSCLDISDGSLCALLAASHGLQNVTSIESKDVSSRIFQQICDANTPNQVEVMCCGCKGLLPEHMKGEQPVDLLVGEPFFYSMQNLPLWQALNFWLRRSALSAVLAPHAVVLPTKARVLAMPVVFEHLHECFGAVGDVSGFDHKYFDQFQASYYTRNFPFPAYMYPFSSVLESPIEIASWSNKDTAHSITTDASIPLPSTNVPNAVIVWVEYILSEENDDHIATTGPAVTYAKQLIRFLPPVEDKAPQDRAVHATFAFSAMEGTVDLSFELTA